MPKALNLFSDQIIQNEPYTIYSWGKQITDEPYILVQL